MANYSPKFHIAMLSSPGMGHLIPLVVLGNRLATAHNAKVTIFSVTTSMAQSDSKLLQLSLEKNVEIIELPPVDISHLIDPSTQVITMLCLMMREAVPLIRSTIAAMDRHPDALIVDLFGTESQSVAIEFGLPKYVYAPCTARFSAITVYCPILDKQIIGQYTDQTEDLKIPGIKPVRPEDVIDPMVDRNDQQYYEYMRMGEEFSHFDGLLVNSWDELEPITLNALRDHEKLGSVLNIPVYPIGPLTRPVEPVVLNAGLFNWLDQQPNDSIMFVSFGSGGMLSAEQTIELAWGLELSQQKFIWVARPPTMGRGDDAFFSSKDTNNNLDFLPEGFLTRTQDFGQVVPMWVEQLKVLSHPSIGGFLSHCGWNSTLESITNGVPMIVWPLYAEQRLNAALLTEELEVAVRPTVLPTEKLVGREEIKEMVRIVMASKDGLKMREKVKKLGISGKKAIGENGSSSKVLGDLVLEIIGAQKE